ncbi:MAG TPA: class I SAM-dependent methyltransferase, partial [Caulobacteraceae bacterium]
MTVDALAGAYEAKSEAYYGAARRDWLDQMPHDRNLRVLELGCGSGATGALALSEGRCVAWGVAIERHGPAATQAACVLTQVIEGDIDRLDLPLAEEGFDLLVMGQVLEHLPNPEAVLARLARFLKPAGVALASTPNIGHWRSVAGLVAGRFDYEAEGVMDRTHLKWFTPRSLRRAFEGAGLTDVSVTPLGWSE